MNAEDLIETIQASGVTSADESSVSAHAEAQAIAEEAYSLL